MSCKRAFSALVPMLKLRGPVQHIARHQRRTVHVAPPYLLDDYTPKYKLLSDARISHKKEEAIAHMKDCKICPRRCGVNRLEDETGYCLIGSKVKVSVIAPHMGEEACIQGRHGSGSVFFSGCSMRCTFCQNYDISHTRSGFDLSPEELADWMIKLQEVGRVENINFVTPEHVPMQVALAIIAAIPLGLKIPVIYNTSSYDTPEALSLMDGLVDIYLADFKLWEPSTSKRLLKAEDYPEKARESLKIMHEQVGDLSFTSDGIAKRGVLLRHLVMPGLEKEGGDIMRYIAKEVSKDMYCSIMEQYHPDAHVGKPSRGKKKEGEEEKEVRYAEINRHVSEDEVKSVRQAAEEAGLWRFDEPARHGLA